MNCHYCVKYDFVVISRIISMHGFFLLLFNFIVNSIDNEMSVVLVELVKENNVYTSSCIHCFRIWI